jgi:hypothetical protein
VATEAAMVAVAIKDLGNSMVMVLGLCVRFVARKDILLWLAGRGSRKIIVARRSLQVLLLDSMVLTPTGTPILEQLITSQENWTSCM